MYKIIKKEKLNPDVELMVVHAPYVSRKCQPGQFIILRVDNKGERIPLTIYDFDRKKETVTIVYQIVGFSTHLLSLKKEGDTILDFAGPLGEPVNITPYKKIIGVAGGLGSAPLYPQLRALANAGIEVDVIIGGRNKEYILFEKEFKKFCHNVYITTDDGTSGEKGFVTNILTKLLQQNNHNIDQVIAIGPVGMMKAVVNITKPLKLPTSVSLNPIMIDGTGMCGCCRVTVDGKIKFACVDGPDFDGLVVDFDELINRQKMFHKQEHYCNFSELRGEKNA